MAGDDPVAEDVDGGCGFWAFLRWERLFWRMLGGEHGEVPQVLFLVGCEGRGWLARGV